MLWYCVGGSSTSDWGVRMFDVLEEKEVKGDSVPFEMEDGRPMHVQWSPDGSILSVGTRSGRSWTVI